MEPLKGHEDGEGDWNTDLYIMTGLRSKLFSIIDQWTGRKTY